jgi:hypothetical protein
VEPTVKATKGRLLGRETSDQVTILEFLVRPDGGVLAVLVDVDGAVFVVDVDDVALYVNSIELVG